ncbi:PglZ domain-containing protein [Anaerobranca gottschalkii]|uniref:PglZ domain-containing protein n=1 Tax=Anaerobranca gottschalkii DSM 13577 TaxID=1120990 RepID=A0A1H9Z2M0_9FIRM|nr:PglZ domain-containing protein [Anaerobranca gottschalkii]SES75705.1 PglZ domain-containing protein [Anaerobranca gottschalkii DSM 13577]
MIEKRIIELFSIEYEKRLLIFDINGFSVIYDYIKLLISRKFQVIIYEDIEAFRLKYEQEIKNSNDKYAVIVHSDIYVPYDIRKQFFEVEISLKSIFPKLHEDTVRRYIKDIDLISFAYGELYSFCDTKEKTEKFIIDKVFSRENIESYCVLLIKKLLPSNDKYVINANEWIEIARKKAQIDYYASKGNITIDTRFVDEKFKNFIFNGYQKLAGEISKDVPAILTKIIDIIANGKTALIIIDGMSLFDFEVISRYWEGIDYDFYCTYAVIPTTTAISRQSLLTGKYPRELKNPFSLSQEEKEFLEAIKKKGYTKKQILYFKGYNPPISYLTKFLVIIINDVDDLVHAQKQGRVGMYNDLSLWAKSGKLQKLIKELYEQGFNIYITSDHGNTCCVGVGDIRNVGVEVETKSKRMLVLKDFAEYKDFFTDKVIKYPGYYLDKDYQYFVCESDYSFDNKDKETMTHGGISIDEVIVPFIKVKAVI